MAAARDAKAVPITPRPGQSVEPTVERPQERWWPELRGAHALHARGIECSMSRKGDCWDSRRELGTLKRELEGIEAMESRTAATISVGEHIDGFYTSSVAILRSTTPAPSSSS